MASAPHGFPDVHATLVVPGPCMLALTLYRHVCRCDQCVRSLLLDYVHGTLIHHDAFALVRGAMAEAARSGCPG